MKQLFLCAILFISISALGQKELVDKPSWRDRIYTGGGLGFNGGTDIYGNKYFNFSVSPIVGYMITPQFSGGLGISYQRVSYTDRDFAYSQYAVMPFLRYNFNDFFLITEYNYINLPQVGFANNRLAEVGRFYRSRFLVGAGYSQPLGARARVNAIAMYDLLYQAPSVFGSPWVFRVFVSF
jgi:hypothetical protein